MNNDITSMCIRHAKRQTRFGPNSAFERSSLLLPLLFCLGLTACGSSGQAASSDPAATAASEALRTRRHYYRIDTGTGAAGTGAAGTGAAGTGAAGTGAAGTGAAGTGTAGTGTAGTSAAGTGTAGTSAAGTGAAGTSAAGTGAAGTGTAGTGGTGGSTACGAGAISSSCTCGGTTHTDGYCCAGGWSASACTTTACATEPLRSTGTTYYVCDCQAGAASGCKSGSDADTGTSSDHAWQSWSKARAQFEAMAAGSTVAFCDGGSWTGAGTAPSTYYRNTKCTAGSTCDWRNYPTTWGGGVKPKIKLAAGLEFLAMGWWREYGNVIHGFRFFNLDIRGQSSDGLTTAENGFQLWGGVTDIDICNVEMHHGLLSALGSINSSTVARVTFRDSYVHDNRGTNICAICGGADDFTISNNVFDYNGRGDMYAHSVYFSQDVGETQCGNGATPTLGYCKNSRLKLLNNTIMHTAWGSAGKCMGVTIAAHDIFDSMLIEGNYISEPAGGAVDPGCFGMQLDGSTETGRFTNLVVRKNRIYNVGGVGIAVSHAPGVVIENNLVVGNAATWSGIAYPEQTYRPGNDLQSNNGTVRNNTVYLSGGGDGSFAVYGQNEGTGHVFANNAIVTGPSTGYCVSAPTGAMVATNSCSLTGSGWWQSLGLDPATANFHPALSSALVGAGTYIDAPTTDLLGVTRHNPPSTGAYETN